MNSLIERQRWLDQVVEPAIEPERPICDPHHHLWDTAVSRYMLDGLLADIGGGHNVVATVFVECLSAYRPAGPEALRPVGETEFVEEIADSAERRGCGVRVAAGIVGFADLTLGDDVVPTLEAHLQASPSRFRGIRHAAGWHESPDIRNAHVNPPKGLLGSAAFRRGFRHLARYGLTFDAWLYHPQIPELTSLADTFPETTIVLDHFGGPLGIGPYAGRRDEVFTEWRRHIDELALRPNVVAKLGGINMTLSGYGWHKRERPPDSEELARATRDYYLHTIDRFGPDRCMFESNFPMDRVSCSYTVLWNAFKRMVADFSERERRALFHDTAVRVYRLDA